MLNDKDHPTTQSFLSIHFKRLLKTAEKNRETLIKRRIYFQNVDGEPVVWAKPRWKITLLSTSEL